MAKKSAGYYSPEAIQSRQETARAEFEHAQKPKVEKTERPKVGGVVSGITPSNAVNPISVPKPSPTSVPTAIPFLAKSIDKYGNPFYGEGFTGWVRKTYAHVFGKENFEIDKAVSEQYKSIIPKAAQKFETATKWSSWGEKLFGLSSQEVVEGFSNVAAAGKTSRDKADTGEITKGESFMEGVAAIIGAEKRFALGNTAGAGVVMGGLQILSMDDVLVRKITSVSQATEQLAGDKAAVKGDSKLSWLTGVSFLANIPGAISNIATGKVTMEEAKETYKNYWAGSQMVYTMVFDNQVQEEFNRQVALGRDPEAVAYDLGNPWIELGGSLVFSPSTYFGMGVPGKVGEAFGLAPEVRKTFWLFGKEKLVYHLPTFGEFLNLGVGTNRLRNAASRFDDVSHIPGLDDAIKKFGNVADDVQAKKLLDEAATAVSRAVSRSAGKLTDLSSPVSKAAKKFFGGTYGLVSPTEASKASLTAREMKQSLSIIIKNSDSLDDAVAVMSDMAKLAKNPQDKAVIARLFKAGKLPFTESGLMTGQILARMEDVVLPIMNKMKGKYSQLEIADDLYKGVDRVIADIMPSMDEMADAMRAVRAGNFTEKQAELAEMYKNVPDYAKTANKVHGTLNKFRSMGINLMSNVYMKFSPAYFNRNILSQGVNIVADLGLGSALDISAAAYRGVDGVVGSTKWTDEVLKINENKIKAILDFLPEGATRGIGNTLGKVAKDGERGFTAAAQNSERITSSFVVLHAARNELLKALPAAIKGAGWDDLTKVLPKEQSNLLFRLLNDNYGNFDNALAEFKRMVGTGKIDAWRVTEVPKRLEQTLHQLQRGDDIKTLLKTANTQDEFAVGMKKILGDLTEQSKNSFREMQSVGGMSDAAVKNMIVDSQEVFGEGEELFRRKVMYWENARIQLKDAVNLARDSINRRLGKIGDAGLNKLWNESSARLSAIQKTEGDFYNINSGIRNVVRELYKEKGTPIANLVERAVYGNNWSLKAAYPDVDWSKITRAEFDDLLWKSYFDNAGEGWKAWNMNFFDGQMDELEKFSTTAFGQGLENSITTFKSDENAFKLAFEYRKIAGQLEEFATAPIEDAATLIKRYDIKDNPKAILNTVNKYLPEGAAKYTSVEEVPLDVMQKAFEARRIAKGLPDALPFPAAYNGEQPTFARALYESMPGLKRDIETFQDAVLSEWGKTVPTVDAGMDDALKAFKSRYDPNFKTAQTKAGLFANGMRDFILHDYEKTNLDMAMSYLMPFQYWTSRTYARWMERFVENPRYANMYMKYKETMAKEHADLPEWWRYNAQIPSLPGINNEPIFFNLEATLNPLYGLLGTDFDDPYKRVDWVSRLVDDMNKAGPSLAPIYSWAVAAHLYSKGQDDAAQRWMGRLFPQTAFIKTILTKMGANINAGPLAQNNELDPFVNLLMGGLDPYERNRVARNLAGLVGQTVMVDGQMVTITEEMAIDASAKQDGDLWDYAIKSALDERAAGQTFSFFAGVGFKTRNPGDVKVDEFYSQYHKLISARSLMPPDEYRQEWDKMREQYPFMDALLIGKKAGPERDTALAYNVLGRIPPGELSDIAEFARIEPYMIEMFYDNKGDLSKMLPQDRTRFMAAITDLSAMLKMPDGATRQEWNYAKQTYAEMNTQLRDRYGEDIQDKISKFFDATDRDAYLQAHPEVQAALQEQNAYVVNTPILSAYYGSIDTVARYYDNQMYETLEKEFGENIVEIADQYYWLKDNQQKTEAASLYNEFNLREYFKRKKEMQVENNARIMETASQIPEGQDYEIRPEFLPQSGIQEEALNYATSDQNAELAQTIWSQLTPASQELIQESFASGEDIPSSVKRQLDYIADRYDLTQREALLLLGVETP